MAPAIITVNNTDNTKTMMWPLDYCRPGQTMPPVNAAALEQAALSPDFEIVTVPESVVAVRTFADAVVEPVVRRADRELRALLQRDGLTVDGGGTQDLPPLRCAQYDAVFSMGQRRSEVHIPLSEGGHPW